MKALLNFIYLTLFFILYSSSSNNKKTDYTIAFGSCNNQNIENLLWNDIKKNNPDLWIWGGDNIYSDTYDKNKLEKDYQNLNNQKGYLNLIKDIPVMATWDDHDYGINDSGKEFSKKDQAQEVFLDFFKVDKNSYRRKQKGIYHSENFKTEKGSIKVIVLDSRFFRTELTKDTIGNKRYIPNTYGKGTILGSKQWKWLTNQLNNSNANFNIIVSSIQVLSAEHGFESWGNFPHEVDKLKKIIKNSNAKGVLILSGDRHISEFSKTNIEGLTSPLIDFTSSGLTHSYSGFNGEPNKYRFKKVVSEISFGILNFNFDKKEITMQMKGKDNLLLQEFRQIYQ